MKRCCSYTEFGFLDKVFQGDYFQLHIFSMPFLMLLYFEYTAVMTLAVVCFKNLLKDHQ